MYYKIIKEIEEKNSLPQWSIIQIDDDKKHIKLDSWNQIDISFLIREKYLVQVEVPPFRIGEPVTTTPWYDRVQYFWKVIAVHISNEWVAEYKTTFISSSDWIYWDNLRKPTELELWLYF